MSRAFFGAFGKRCHVQICCLRQKMSRNFEGRISRAQSALEQAYQNFCTNSREAGGLLLRVIAKRAARSSFQMLFFQDTKKKSMFPKLKGSCSKLPRSKKVPATTPSQPSHTFSPGERRRLIASNRLQLPVKRR